MSSANGLCPHNNLSNYCWTCAREQAAAQRAAMSGGMGTTCPAGKYDLKIFGVSTGQCVPTSGTLADVVQSAATGTIATSIATSPSNVAAGKKAGISAGLSWIGDQVQKYPIPILAGVGAIIFFAMRGVPLPGRRA